MIGCPAPHCSVNAHTSSTATAAAAAAVTVRAKGSRGHFLLTLSVVYESFQLLPYNGTPQAPSTGLAVCVCVGGRMRSKERGRNQCWPGVSTPHTYTTAIGRSFDIGILYFFFKGKTDRLYTEKLKIKLTASRKQHYTVDLIYK